MRQAKPCEKGDLLTCGYQALRLSFDDSGTVTREVVAAHASANRDEPIDSLVGEEYDGRDLLMMATAAEAHLLRGRVEQGRRWFTRFDEGLKAFDPGAFDKPMIPRLESKQRTLVHLLDYATKLRDAKGPAEPVRRIETWVKTARASVAAGNKAEAVDDLRKASELLGHVVGSSAFDSLRKQLARTMLDAGLSDQSIELIEADVFGRWRTYEATLFMASSVDRGEGGAALRWLRAVKTDVGKALADGQRIPPSLPSAWRV